jgi:hypothetical protein
MKTPYPASVYKLRGMSKGMWKALAAMSRLAHTTKPAPRMSGGVIAGLKGRGLIVSHGEVREHGDKRYRPNYKLTPLGEIAGFAARAGCFHYVTTQHEERVVANECQRHYGSPQP